MTCLLIESGWATPYKPTNDNEVLLLLDKSQAQIFEQKFQISSEAQALTLASQLLSTANQPGNSQQYQLAEGVLAPYITSTSDPNLWYVWAQIKQHQHQFTAATQQLNQIFQQQENHVAGRLMAARLALIQRDLPIAKQHCQALLGYVDILTTNICLLEVDSYQGRLENSYENLSQLVSRWPVPETHQLWVTLMLVDMAMRQGDFKAAKKHLIQSPEFTDSSYLTTWSDVSLANNEGQMVMDKLVSLIDSGLVLEDGLMLRLALSERQLNQHNKTNNLQWIEQLNQRIELRAQRDEFMHANEMARYFIDLEPNKQQALYWAELNWQEAKEHQDELLLERANQLEDEL